MTGSIFSETSPRQGLLFPLPQATIRSTYCHFGRPRPARFGIRDVLRHVLLPQEQEGLQNKQSRRFQVRIWNGRRRS